MTRDLEDHGVAALDSRFGFHGQRFCFICSMPLFHPRQRRFVAAQGLGANVDTLGQAAPQASGLPTSMRSKLLSTAARVVAYCTPGLEPDWLIGTSIGAINSTLLADHIDERRLRVGVGRDAPPGA
jgi:hypothetical protein